MKQLTAEETHAEWQRLVEEWQAATDAYEAAGGAPGRTPKAGEDGSAGERLLAAKAAIDRFIRDRRVARTTTDAPFRLAILDLDSDSGGRPPQAGHSDDADRT